jgi:hypothetical protein
VSGFSFATTDEDFGKLNWRAGFAVGCDGTDFKIFLFDGVRFATTNVNEDVSGSGEIANGRIVPRRVREHLYAEQQEKRWNTLKAEQEAPFDVGVSVIDEGKAKGEPIGNGYTEVVGDEDVSKEATAVI